jgi:hypothetical protein
VQPAAGQIDGEHGALVGEVGVKPHVGALGVDARTRRAALAALIDDGVLDTQRGEARVVEGAAAAADVDTERPPVGEVLGPVHRARQLVERVRRGDVAARGGHLEQ